MRTLMAAVLVSFLAISSARAAQTVEAGGKVETVTLYRGQALVTRVISFDAPAGAVQLVVGGLPESILPQSLYASSGKDLQVRAVRYRTHAMGEAPNEEVRQLDAQFAEVEKKTRANTQMQQAARSGQSYLDKLECFTAPTANIEMAKGVLNAETLQKITAMMFELRTKGAKEMLQLSEEGRTLAEQSSLLQRKRGELTRSRSKTAREAVVFLDKAGEGKGELRLSYLVEQASWSPIYNVRGGVSVKDVSIEFGGLVQQTSGEDWDGVSLTLSTAGAALVADGPGLAPLRLALTQAQEDYEGVDSLQQRVISNQQKLVTSRLAQQRAASSAEQVNIQWEMNSTANMGQSIELSARPEDVAVVNKAIRQQGSGLAANYSIAGKVSLESRNDSQMVQIVKLALPAAFFYEAVPLLTESVYRYAEFTNTSDTSLLEGRASVYLDGEFVGTTDIPMVAQGQKVTLGFGTNPQLRAWREFISKEEKGQMFGGNKTVTYRYRLVLDNYSDKPLTVRTLDRMPVQTEQVRVFLGKLKDEISTDGEYLRAYLPQGILRWDVEVPAKSARETARLIEYSFQLEFDSKLHIAAGEARPSAASKADFERILEKRQVSH